MQVSLSNISTFFLPQKLTAKKSSSIQHSTAALLKIYIVSCDVK